MNPSFTIHFDYRFDQHNFFNPATVGGMAARQALAAAGEIWQQLIRDEFTDIAAPSELLIIRPDTGERLEFTYEQGIDDLVIFVGGQDLGDNSLGRAGPGGKWVVGSEEERRYLGNNFEPWSGSVSFDISTPWFFDPTPASVNDVPPQQFDFISVALHEIGHVLGIGSSQAFRQQIRNNTFVGPQALYLTQGGGIALHADLAHLEAESLGNAHLQPGEAQRPGNLELAILADLGYQVEIDLVEFVARELQVDVIQYGASHRDLTQAYGYDPQGLAQHYLSHGQLEGRSTDNFDEIGYLAANPDLIPLYRENPQEAASHYLNYGAREGRSLTFPANQYLASHPDLRQAYGPDRQGATAHYVQHGFQEGRSLGGFAAEQYLASHPDLLTAYGLDTSRATDHYVDFGVEEGRRPDNFPEYNYIASYPDLLKAFQLDGEQATWHYLVAGSREGRGISFSPERYLALNGDLAQAFGSDTLQATFHYILHGFEEGRRIS